MSQSDATIMQLMEMQVPTTVPKQSRPSSHTTSAGLSGRPADSQSDWAAFVICMEISFALWRSCGKAADLFKHNMPLFWLLHLNRGGGGGQLGFGAIHVKEEEREKRGEEKDRHCRCQSSVRARPHSAQVIFLLSDQIARLGSPSMFRASSGD